MPDNQRINILHIITQLDLGGAQKNVLSILSGLDDKKYNKHLIASADGILLEDARKIPGLNLLCLSSLRRSVSLPLDLLAFWKIFSYIKRHRIKIVHTHSSKAGILGRWAAKMAGVPITIHTVHGWPFHDFLKFPVKNFYILLERLTARITNRLIAVSEKDIKTGLAYHIGVGSGYVLVRCGIDNREFNDHAGFSSVKKDSLMKGNGAAFVGMVACLKPQKNPADFIKSAQMILSAQPNTKFLLVGDGMLRPQLEKKIKENNLQENISILGWRRDVNRILPQLDVLVLTSLWEGLPMVFLEAMACSKPIVAYNVGGAAEVIKDGVNGFLVPAGDVEDFANKVSLLLEDKELRQNMGRMGKEMVSNEMFSISFMVDKIERLYAEELSKKTDVL
ncbi:MAG: glycosyltransferase family 4 protein [Candidatus Omnitrophota bacterium]|nr:glycosyltransferase family 4 protein [Candidatus Omnitrophota bacterium]